MKSVKKGNMEQVRNTKKGRQSQVLCIQALLICYGRLYGELQMRNCIAQLWLNHQ